MSWRRFLRRAQWDEVRRCEIAAHLQLETEENIARGMTLAAARRGAQRKLGNAALVREEIYGMNTVGILDALGRDIHYAFRSTRRNLVFASIAVLTLALGIGANSALFSLVNAVLIEPLPYPDSGRLVRLWPSSASAPRQSTALPDYREWRRRNHTFSELGAFYGFTYNLTSGDRPELLQATCVTASIWPTLGIRPLIGRLFQPSDEQWGQHRVVLLSEALWRRRFNADRGVVGRMLRMNGEMYIVVGVMPRVSHFGGPLTEIWTPISFAPGDNMDSRENRFSEVLGRLRPGVTIAEAQRDLDGVAAQVAQEVPGNKGVGVGMVGFQELVVGAMRPTLLLLFGAAGIVLLIACCNVANLLLSRASARRRELAVRTALGAARGRLMRQLLTESLLLAGFGLIAGLGISYGLMRVLVYLAPAGIPRIQTVSLDGTVAAFTSGLALLTGLAFGVWPSWQGANTKLGEGMKEASRGSSAARSGGRVRQGLIVVQVALSLVLLIGAGLLISSLARLQRVDPGFAPDHLLTLQLNLPPRYSQERAAVFMQEATAALRSIPSIRAAGATTALPLGTTEWGKYFHVEGRATPASLSQVPNVNYRQITPGYFRAMGAHLHSGRAFSDQDRSDAPRVAIVNETLARRFWPEGDPIGKRIILAPPKEMVPTQDRAEYEKYWMVVVGVVADLKSVGLDQRPNPEAFSPLAQALETLPTFYLVLRTPGDPLVQRAAVETAIHRLDPNLPLIDVQTMENRLSVSLARRRFSLFLMALFAVLALSLALVGLYGVIAYAVNQRTQEIGIRAALGAKASDLMKLVVGQGLGLTALGIVFGLGSAAALSRLIREQLFEVKAIDPLLYAGIAALLLLLAGAACWVPGRRAARIDPANTLRDS